jgi:hypothetical protein
MDYKVASNIRGKSFSDLMADKISGGAGIGSSIRGAISDKLKAKATGIKEKFDPMNIARAVTGGSRLGPAVLGRLTGRSQADIDYFAGNKNKKSSYTQVPNSMSTPGENLGGSAVSVLNKMLSFMVASREEDKKRKDTAKQFTEEQRVEDQRRHNEFLSILREYTSLSGTGSTTQVKKDDGGLLSGFMDIVKSMITSAISGVTKLFNTALKAYEWIKDLKILARLAPYAVKLATFLGSTLGATLIATLTPAALLLYLAKGEKESIEANPNAPEYKDNPYAMKLRGEAKTIGQATEINIRKATRQFKRQEIVEFVNSKLTDTELINSPGAPGADRATLQKWLSENRKPSDMFQGSVAAIAGQPETAVPAGGRASFNAAKDSQSASVQTTPATYNAAKDSQSANPIPEENKTTPVPSAPMSSRMNDAVIENQTLSLNTTGDMQTPIAPIISTTNNSTSTQDRPIPATATVRDTTPILDHVVQMSVVPV